MIFSRLSIRTALQAAVVAGMCVTGTLAQAQSQDSAKCIVVDNSDPGFSASSNWGTSPSAGDKYGPDYRYRATEPVYDPAIWQLPRPVTGTFQISVWYTAGTNRTPAAAYILPNGSTVVKNQQANGGQWNTLGTLSVTNSTLPVTLSCYGPTGYIIIADAVRYCHQ